LTVDHVLPRSRGGDTTWTNVVAACLRCNLKKGNRLPEETGMRLVHEPIHPKFVFSTHMLRHPHAHSLLDSWRKYLVAVPTPSYDAARRVQAVLRVRAPRRPAARHRG